MRRLGRFAAGFVLGCAACVLGLPALPAVILGAFAALASALFRGLRAKRLRPVLCGLAIALFWCAVYQAVVVAPIGAFCRAGEREISAVVTEYPTRSRYGSAVLIRAQDGKRSIPAVLYYQEEAELAPGDRISCTAKIRAASPENLGRDEYYASRGVWMTASCRGKLTVTRGGFSVRYAPAYAAKRLKDACAQAFASDVSGFLTALLTGDKQGLTYRQKNELSLTGIYHVVAVSGMHVSLLAGLVMLLFAGKRKLTALLGLPLVWFFVLLTGANASSVRAGVMQSILLLAPLAGRENDPPTAFAAALTVLLAENPWALRNVGLLLSFASTGGILLFARPLYRAMWDSGCCVRARQKHPVLARGLRPVITALCCSLASSAVSLPICAYYFKLLSMSGFLTNMLLLWLVSLVFSVGLPIVVLAVLSPALAMGPAWLLAWPVRLILWSVHQISRLPYGAVTLENTYALIFAAFFYGAVWLVCLRPGKLRLCVTLAAMAGTFAVCMGLAALDYKNSAFTFTALDVGQGQCLVYTADGQTSLIDCGGAQDESGEMAARYLTTNGVYTVERLVLTHLDADHCNGAAQLLSRVRVKTLWLPYGAQEEESAMLSGILQSAARAGTQTMYVQKDTEFLQANGKVTIFAPNSPQTGNDGGLCVLAEHEKYDILVTGDLSQMAEYRLLSTHELRDIELLVAGHHGAKTSTSDALLRQTGAPTVVISVGQDNSYGHPAPDTLARIEAAGAEIYRTDTMGTIVIRGGTYGKETDGGKRR